MPKRRAAWVMLRRTPVAAPSGSLVEAAMTSPRRPLSVAHVTGEVGFSGGELQVFLLLEGLRKRGHHSVLLCPPESRSLREASRRGIEARPIRTGNDWSLRSMWEIRRELQASAPDLVHLHTGRANWLGGLAAWYLGLPALTTRRMDRAVKRDARTRFMYGRVVRRAVAISSAVRARLIEGGVPAGDDPPDPERGGSRAALPAARPGGDARRSRPRPRRPLLLVVAALVHRKGIDVLLAALGAARGRGLRPALWIAGQGPARPALEKQARELGLDDQVRFLGQRSDVADLLSACDVFILPSRHEGLGVAALEAMAAGRRSWPPAWEGSPRPSCTSARVCSCRPRIRRRSRARWPGCCAIRRCGRGSRRRARRASPRAFGPTIWSRPTRRLYGEVLAEAGRS